MPRYFVQRPRAIWIDDDVGHNDLAKAIPTVPDHEATDTGLLDSDGNAIMRAPRPIGFGRMEEW